MHELVVTSGEPHVVSSVSTIYTYLLHHYTGINAEQDVDSISRRLPVVLEQCERSQDQERNEIFCDL